MRIEEILFLSACGSVIDPRVGIVFHNEIAEAYLKFASFKNIDPLIEWLTLFQSIGFLSLSARKK